MAHIVSTSQPTNAALGDEWFNPTTNQLYKLIPINGTTLNWIPYGAQANLVYVGGGGGGGTTTVTSNVITYVPTYALVPSLYAETGQVLITASTTWTVPINVTSISLVAVGAGGGGGRAQISTGGGGGGLVYVNNIPVAAGQTYTVVIGSAGAATPPSVPGPGAAGGNTYFFGNTYIIAYGGAGGQSGTNNTGFPADTAGGSYLNNSGYPGGGGTGGVAKVTPGISSWSGGGGGGAAGYSGNGGNGTWPNYPSLGNNATDGSGGGGAGGTNLAPGSGRQGGGGGGVGLLGQFYSGVVDAAPPGGGGGGSGGTPGATFDTVGTGGNYGGGGGGGTQNSPSYLPGNGAPGALRIIWGTGRAFPTTLTIDIDRNSEPLVPLQYSGMVGWYTAPSVASSTWVDISGNNANAVISGASVATFSAGQNASNLTSALYGSSTSHSVLWPTSILPSTYTLFHVTRYSGGTNKRIYQGQSQNIFFGHWNALSGQFYINGWLTDNVTNYHSTNWAVYTAQNALGRSNGVTRGTGGSGVTYDRLGINASSSHTEDSTWYTAECIVYNRTLSSTEYTAIENYLIAKYGIT
jgi:hypothetical protein